MESTRGCHGFEYRVFQDARQRIVACLMHGQDDLDGLALDRSDYEAILQARTWQALMKWESDDSRKDKGAFARAQFVCKSLWSEARQYMRKRNRAKRSATVFSLRDDEEVLLDEGFELRALTRLELEAAPLRDAEWRALQQYLTDGGMGGDRAGVRALNRARVRLSRHLTDGNLS